MADVEQYGTLTGSRAHPRWMCRPDLEAVLSIAGRADHAWHERDFLRELRSAKSIGLVAELAPVHGIAQIAAVMVYRLYACHFRLRYLAVDLGFRRRGIGGQLLRRIESGVSVRRGLRRRIDCVAPENSLSLQLFLRSRGFRATGVQRGQFGEQDGYVMSKDIGRTGRKS